MGGLVANLIQELSGHRADSWLPNASLGESTGPNLFLSEAMYPPVEPSWMPTAPGLAAGGRPSWLADDDASALATNLDTPSWLTNVTTGVSEACHDGDPEAALPPAESTLDSQRAYQMGWEAAMHAKSSMADQLIRAEGRADAVGEDAVPNTNNDTLANEEVAGNSSDKQKDNEKTENAMTVLDWAVDQAQFADLPPLQQGWIRIKSKTTGRIYYLNTDSGKTTYTAPMDLPPGWVQMKSRSTGKTYFWNEELQKSQFACPGT